MTQTLDDWLRPGLRAVLVGINPSPPSVAAGYYFASASNRFWPALNGCGLLDTPLEPGPAAMRKLLDEHAIGFTDLVKRPTPQARDLRAADFREGAADLARRLESARPALIWFQGKLAISHFRRHAMGLPPATDWGLQPARFAGAVLAVTPSPSAANAAWSLAALTEQYTTVASAIRQAHGRQMQTTGSAADRRGQR